MLHLTGKLMLNEDLLLVLHFNFIIGYVIKSIVPSHFDNMFFSEIDSSLVFMDYLVVCCRYGMQIANCMSSATNQTSQ